MRSSKVRNSVRAFYDTFGWEESEGGDRYAAELLHEDLDPMTQDYMDRNEIRFRTYFRDGGDFFLDAGCGAEPRLRFSPQFKWHVCADISLVGLQGAAKKLGARGLYVVSDLSQLPFREGAFAGVLASHCLYHVDQDLQPVVLDELYRVTKLDKHIVVFYVSPYNLWSFIRQSMRSIIRKIRGRHKSQSSSPAGTPESIKTAPALYFQPLNPFRLSRAFPVSSVLCLRTLSKEETELLRRLHLLSIAVPVLSVLERAFPRLMSYIGKYTTITITKVAL